MTVTQDFVSSEFVSSAAVQYADCDTADHAAWVKNDRALRRLPKPFSAYRGCVGVALVLTDVSDTAWAKVGDRLFVPNASVGWATLIDAAKADGTIARWAAFRPATLRFGVPVFGPGEVGSGWDFGLPPFDAAVLRMPKGQKDVWPTVDTLSPRRSPHLFRVFNQVTAAMNSFAAVKAGRARAVAYGDHASRTPPPSGEWMPTPYLAFRAEHRETLFDRVAALRTGAPAVYAAEVFDTFLAALTLALEYRAPFAGRVDEVRKEFYQGVDAVTVRMSGDRGEQAVARFAADTAVLKYKQGGRFSANEAVGRERLAPLPQNWLAMTRDTKVAVAERLLNRQSAGLFRLWFDRCGVTLKPGFVHFPAALVSPVALTHGVEAETAWELNGCTTYYHDAADAVIYPPVPVDNFRGHLPGDVAFDLAPAGPQFS